MGTRVKNSSVGALQKETLMTRAHIPPDWDDNTIITVKDCQWPCRGPRWWPTESPHPSLSFRWS